MVQSNELKLLRQTVLTPVSLPEPVQEQSIELDYVLPDYYPDFFRMLHCSAETDITHQQYRDGVLEYSMSVRLRVLYCAQDSNTVQAVTQQLDYTRQFPMPAAVAERSCAPCFRLTADTAYLNCRAVSSRRIDLRGAVRVTVQVCAEQSREVIAGAEGMHIQTKTEPVTFVSRMLRAEKRFTLSEQMQIPPAQPPLLAILRDEVRLRVNDTRIAAGKLICKGEAAVTLLYTASDGIETVQAVFPFSQIAETDGLRDDMPLNVTARLNSRLYTPQAEGDGDIRTVMCDLQITLCGEAAETASAELLTDAFSTVYPVTMQKEMLPLLTAPVPVSDSTRVRAVLSRPDTALMKVYAAWAEPVNVRTAPDTETGGTRISGELHACVLAADADGVPQMLEDSVPFTWSIAAAAGCLPEIAVPGCSYTLTGADSVTVQAELSLSGYMNGQSPREVVTELSADADADMPDGTEYALRLYFGQPDESLWEIAKRFRTVPDAVRAENDCPGDTLTAAQMLLIPNVK